MDYRKKEHYTIIQLPESPVDEKRIGDCGCKGCEDFMMVLADKTDNTSYKNDITGIYVKKGLIADTITFTLMKCDGTIIPNTTTTTLGTPGVFPNDPLAVGYIFDWKKILNLANGGVGLYTIKVNYTIAGATGEYIHGAYKLSEYSIENAASTVRVWSEFNSYFLKTNIDFTGSNFKDSIRFFGYFGYRQPDTQINNLIDKGRRVEKITRENLNKYTLITDPLLSGTTKPLIDFHFLAENTIKITDHNRNNHDYQLLDKELIVKDTPEIEYIPGTRFAKITATFGDKVLDNKSYYNG